MPKRLNKEIKEYSLKSGKKRWKFQTYLGQDANGKRISVTRQGFKNYTEAISAYNKLKLQGSENHYKRPNQIKTDEMYQIWFEDYKGQVKESSANKNYEVYKNHVQPIFGNIYMDKIQVKDVQHFANEKAKQIVKYKDAVRQLNILFEYAIRFGYVQDNPVKRIIMPKKTSRPRRDVKHNVYTRKELTDFLTAAEEYGLRAYTYFKIISSTGLRKSEALALTWKDINLKQNKIDVNKTLAYGYNSKLLVQKPKSQMSIRTLPINPNLKDVLIKYREHELNQPLVCDKLFHTFNGAYLRLSKPDQWLQAIYKKNPKLKHITLHGFRHTFATLLISETNVKPKTVQMLMGHETITMTMDIYTHLTNKNKKDARDAVNFLNI
ncbi:site-specific integrase [Lactobacillus sp. ESL0677]|uniref:tyrosine-type recombinase/integrase n=1 Tax=Lactobacillus sp. ESL0677 TaxID=2983208 RepID=UPI0023F68E21|nr:site-specific integrase [Lactobacillus sp. ESL0677]WEV36263.1 site-specific integrase [Lactobacillus sp. ESL0677]